MTGRVYKGIKRIASESKHCAKGLYYCIAYDPEDDKLISEEFTGSTGTAWVNWSEGIINIGIIDHKMTMAQIRQMCEETLREIGIE